MNALTGFLSQPTGVMVALLVASVLSWIAGFSCGLTLMYRERQRWLKIAQASARYQKGVVDENTAQAASLLARMGVSTGDASKAIASMWKNPHAAVMLEDGGAIYVGGRKRRLPKIRP